MIRYNHETHFCLTCYHFMNHGRLRPASCRFEWVAGLLRKATMYKNWWHKCDIWLSRKQARFLEDTFKRQKGWSIMDKAPMLYSLKEICWLGDFNRTAAALIDNQWVPARPIGLFSIISRLKLAWGVFTGRYDAVKWPGGQ